MSIQHHLNNDLLMAYAVGELPEALNLVIATHVSLCDECRARLESYDALGGAVVEHGYAAVADGSLDACLARISGLGQEQPRKAMSRQTKSVFPAPLMDYVGGGLETVKWRPIGMGAKQVILRTADTDASVRLLYIPGGAAMPDHGHNGLELTLVLQGAFRDEGQRFARGDIEVADASVEHTPVAEEGSVCICLAATQGKLKFNSLLPRLAQPFLRI